MINFIINKITDTLTYNNISYDKDLVTYGITIILRYSLCFTISLVINLYTHSTLYYLLFLFLFYLLRSEFGGVHFKNNTVCIVTSILTVSIIPNFIKNIELNSTLMMMSIFPILAVFYIIGPIDNDNKRLSKSEIIYHRKRGYIKILLMLCIFIAINSILLRKSIMGAIYFQTIVSVFGLVKKYKFKTR